MFRAIEKNNWRKTYRLFQLSIELIKLLQEPDASKDYWNDIEQNNIMYSLFKKERPTYYSIAKAMTLN
jgi:hypothetical protein